MVWKNALREKLRQNLTRGKIECSLRIDSKKQAAAELNLNKELANQSDSIFTMD